MGANDTDRKYLRQFQKRKQKIDREHKHVDNKERKASETESGVRGMRIV